MSDLFDRDHTRLRSPWRVSNKLLIPQFLGFGNEHICLVYLSTNKALSLSLSLYWTILGAGRAGDPSQPPRTKWGSPAPSAQPTDEAEQMLDATLNLG